MAEPHINENTEIGNTGKYLKDIMFDFKEGKKIGTLGFTKIGKWDNGMPVYLIHGPIGNLGSATTVVLKWNIPNFYGFLDFKFLAANGSARLGLPYIYPNMDYTNYWITIEQVFQDQAIFITGTDRTSWTVYLTAIVVLTKDI